MKPYPEYKDSEVEWIGEIPEHWEISKIKYTTYVKGRIGWQGLTSDEYMDEGAFLITGTDFTNGKINWNKCHHVNEERYDQDSYIQLKENDLLITKDGTIGKIALVKDLPDKATLNSGIFLTRPLNNTYITDFMFWILNSKIFSEYIEYIKTGSTINHLYQNTFVEFSFPLPETEEQKNILIYLNDKTKKIDTLIKKKQKQIELLKEQRTTTVNHAVTKGLDPDVKMKDSGIEWLGEVPEHWEVVPLRRVTLARCDGPFGSGLKSSHYTDHGVRVVRLTNIGHAEFKNSDAAFISPTHYDSLGDHSVEAGDVLIAGLGDDRHPTGRSCVAPVGIEPAMVKADCFRFRLNQSRIHPEFAALHLTATAVATSAILSTGATRQRINLQSTTGRAITIPPLLEQEAILAYISENTALLDIAISHAHREIALLQEYRTSLISEAVTGKIDVRGEVE